jgi:SepF-like predicted cell division protein (DUF552 family)
MPKGQAQGQAASIPDKKVPAKPAPKKDQTLDKVSSRSRKKKAKKEAKKYKVPSDNDVLEAIQKAMTGNHIIRSQTELRALVQAELKAKDPAFSITNERLRRIALEKAGLQIEMQSRELEDGPALARCPVCKSPLKATKNDTIYGGTVTLGFKCTKCPYWTGIKRRVPTRYTFYMRKK